MPGLLGFVLRAPDVGLPARFDKALQRMQRHGELRAERADDAHGQWASGRTHLGALQPAPQGPTDHGLVVWFHGDLWNAAALKRRERLPADASTARLVARLYKRYGADFSARLEGAFVAAVLDPDARRVTLAADRVGSYPLYWNCDEHEFSFSSDLTALLAASTRRPRLDFRAVADYLTAGFVLGDRTLAQDVRLLGPGEVLEYNWASGVALMTSAHTLASLFERVEWSESDYLEALRTTFAKSVQQCLAGDHTFAMSLSGGLDSRAILGAINGTRVTTYTLGVKGCADEVIGGQLARLAGRDHLFFELDDGYLRDFLPNLEALVSLTDGLYFSHGLTEMLALTFIGDLHSTVLLRGHGGELAKMRLAWPLHTDDSVYQHRNLDSFADYLAVRANYLTPTISLPQMLQPRAAAAAGPGWRQSIGEILSDCRLSAPEACSYLYLREHHRRYTIPSLELFRSKIEVRLPFLDPAFLRVLFSAPPGLRDDTTIHREIVRAGQQALLKVRNSNTGASVDAGPWTERVMDKVNTVLKRANVSGFRHYHNFDAWMRRMLLESVEQELVAKPARIHDWIQIDVLRRLVSETSTGAANHGYLLQALLILELWQRQNGAEA